MGAAAAAPTRRAPPPGWDTPLNGNLNVPNHFRLPFWFSADTQRYRRPVVKIIIIISLLMSPLLGLIIIIGRMFELNTFQYKIIGNIHIIIIIISPLMSPPLGHRPSLWITHKENGL
jgi:hypothetical protein